MKRKRRNKYNKIPQELNDKLDLKEFANDFESWFAREGSYKYMQDEKTKTRSGTKLKL